LKVTVNIRNPQLGIILLNMLFVRRLKAAEMLGVTPRTLSRWDKAGTLKFTRIGGRIVGCTPETLEAFARGENATTGI
jgi:predicted site-specific integrase-resolvase